MPSSLGTLREADRPVFRDAVAALKRTRRAFIEDERGNDTVGLGLDVTVMGMRLHLSFVPWLT